MDWDGLGWVRVGLGVECADHRTVTLLQFFLHCSFFLRCSFFFALQFFCVAVGPGHAHMTPWLITHNLIYVAAADDDVDVVLFSNIFRQIFTRGEKVSITT